MLNKHLFVLCIGWRRAVFNGESLNVVKAHYAVNRYIWSGQERGICTEMKSISFVQTGNHSRIKILIVCQELFRKLELLLLNQNLHLIFFTQSGVVVSINRLLLLVLFLGISRWSFLFYRKLKSFPLKRT